MGFLNLFPEYKAMKTRIENLEILSKVGDSQSKIFGAGLADLFERVVALENATPDTPAPNDSGLIAGKYESVDVGNYFVQNNIWGADTAQVLRLLPNGFGIVSASHDNPLNGPPAAYPSIVSGVHYDRRSAGTVLPKRLSEIRTLQSSVDVAYGTSNDAVYNVSYDIWLDSEPKTSGQNEIELMIWLNKVGDIQPIGSKQTETFIAGKTWDLWHGNIGWDVFSYVAKEPVTDFSADLLQFIPVDMKENNYLTSVQVGMEPWRKGAGLSISNFNVEIA